MLWLLCRAGLHAPGSCPPFAAPSKGRRRATLGRSDVRPSDVPTCDPRTFRRATHSCSFSLDPCLIRVQLVVPTLRRDQLLVAPSFNNLTALYDQDLVRAPNGAEPMCDNESRSAFQELL